MATENLQIPDIAAAQNQKEVTANAAHNLLDRAMNKNAQKTITGDDSLTATEARENFLIELTGSPGSGFTLDMPDTNKRTLAILNNTGQTATIRNSAGAGADQPVVDDGGQSFFHYDGVDFTALGGAGGAAAFVDLTDTPGSIVAHKMQVGNAAGNALQEKDIAYDVGSNTAGVPAINSVVMRFLAVRNFRLPVDLTNSQGRNATAPSAQTDFDIQKNGSSIGTMSFASSATTATFTFSSATDFVAGDRLEVVAPANLNGLADLAITLSGIRRPAT